MPAHFPFRLLISPVGKIIHSCMNNFALTILFALALDVCDALGESFAPRAQTTRGQTQKSPALIASTTNPKPKLVLLIAVDQFRYDYLERFGDLFGSRGIGR